MSVQKKFAPYLNRFTTLLQQHATATLEFKCKMVTHIELQKHSFRNTQKMAVKPTQLRRLQKRAAARAEQITVAANEKSFK